MTTYTKHDTNKSQDANAQSIAHTNSKRTAILIYIWAKFFSHIMRIYIGGGGFRLAIMRVYICGKIFALHNTHIKYGENPKIIMQKNYLESIKIFSSKMYMCGRFLKLHIIRLYSTLNLFHFNDLLN